MTTPICSTRLGPSTFSTLAKGPSHAMKSRLLKFAASTSSPLLLRCNHASFTLTLRTAAPEMRTSKRSAAHEIDCSLLVAWMKANNANLQIQRDLRLV